MVSLKPRTLLWRMGSALLIIQAIVAVALAWFSLDQLHRYNIEQTLHELERITPVLAQRYAPLLSAHNPEAIEALTRSDQERTGLRVTIISSQGVVLGDSHHDPATMDNHSTRPEILAAATTGQGATVRHSATLDADLVYHALRLNTGADQTTFIRTALPLRQVNAQLARIIRLVALAAGLSLLVTAGFILLVSRRLSAVIVELGDHVSRFAAGDLQHRIPTPKSRELASLVESLNDMTDQLRGGMAELGARRIEINAILQAMNGGVMALRLDHRIAIMNDAASRMLRVSADEARGRMLQEVVRQPALNQFVADAMDEPGGPSLELELQGEPKTTLSASSAALHNDAGLTTGLLITLDDVTELRRLESMRSDFASNVSHELRTPITNIKGYIETLLESDSLDQQQAKQFLSIVKRNADRLGAIVDDMLALSKLERPEMRDALEMSQTRLSGVVERVIAQLEREASRSNIATTVEAPGDLLAEINAPLIEQALTNLLSNAIKYSPEGSTVRITVGPATLEDELAAVAITVEDQGPGIAARHLPRLFERFYRVDKARSRDKGGTGLGLAIVKHIARLHHGRIDVDSVVGRGSIFTLILPVSAPASSP